MKPLRNSFEIDRSRTIIFTFLLIITIWMIWSLNVYKAFLTDKSRTSGTLGDSYGVITSFFSALGFAGLLYTILLQRKELSETRKEFQKQNVNLKRQRFETTYFSMIQIHLSNLRSIEYDKRLGTIAIDSFLDILIQRFQGISNDKEVQSKNTYNHLLLQSGFVHIISPYIRSLAAVYEVTKNSSLKNKAFNRYLRILKSYISSIEIEFLFYHCRLCTRNNINYQELYLLDQFMEDSGLKSEAAEYVKMKRDIVF